MSKATIALLGILVSACSTPAPTTEPVPTSTLDETGILIVDVGEQVQAGAVTRKQAGGYETALMLAETNGDDIGYPWIDPVSGELILSAATPRGVELIQRAGIDIPFKIRQVAHGAAELRRIQDDVTFLGSRGVPNAQLIYATIPDHRDNRALIVMSAMDRALLDYLAANYPADAIAVQVDPDSAGGGTL